MELMADRLLRFARENWISLLIVIGLPLAWLMLRSEGTPLASAEDFDRLIATGQPTVVYFFSNG